MNDRERALRILEKIERRSMPADAAIDREPGIESRDFVRTLVFAVLRWRGRIDHAVEQLAGRPLARIDPSVLALLRLGGAQVWFTAIPAYAAVSETTSLASRVAPRAKSFVNAVMRRISERSLESLDPAGSTVEAIAARTSHPAWLVARWAGTLGIERAEAIARANQELSYPDVLVNRMKWSVEEASAALSQRAIEHSVSTLVPGVIRLRTSTEPVADLVRDGLVYPMDEGSVAVASLLPISDGRVADLAAAPGGKSLVLAMRGASVVSVDLSVARILPLRRAHRSMFGRDAVIVAGDGLRAPFRRQFDAVLLDAPCSATGTIRRNPEVRWRLDDGDPKRMSSLQLQLLRSAMDLAACFVLYATCSLEVEENDDVISAALDANHEFEKADLTKFADAPLRTFVDKGTLRLTPECGTDGFTATLMRRKGSS